MFRNASQRSDGVIMSYIDRERKCFGDDILVIGMSFDSTFPQLKHEYKSMSVFF